LAEVANEAAYPNIVNKYLSPEIGGFREVVDRRRFNCTIRDLDDARSSMSRRDHTISRLAEKP